MDFAGKVERVAPDVSSFKQGDRVFGMSANTYGAHAEYLCLHEDGPVAIMPKDTGFDEAVVCEGAWYANNCLVRFEYPINEGDTNIPNMSDMLKELCKQRKLQR